MRWLPWQDVVSFGVLPVAYTGLCIAAVATPQEWPLAKVAITISVGILLYLIAAGVVLRRWLTRPTFVTRMGTRVWTNGLPIKPEDVVDAMGFYAANVGRLHPRLDEPTILSLFSSARVEFTEGLILWGKRKCNGLQKGTAVKVRWMGGFGHNAFFHELHHMMDEMLLGLLPDYKHERAWWDVVPQLKQGWLDGPKKEAVPASVVDNEG